MPRYVVPVLVDANTSDDATFLIEGIVTHGIHFVTTVDRSLEDRNIVVEKATDLSPFTADIRYEKDLDTMRWGASCTACPWFMTARNKTVAQTLGRKHLAFRHKKES